MRQLTGVLDGFMSEVTRKVRLYPQDVLVMAWMVERPGISGSHIAFRLGRQRQGVHRALQRLEDRSLVQRYTAGPHNRTKGWGLTEKGTQVWTQIERGFLEQDQQLQNKGLVMKSFLHALKRMMEELMGTAHEMANLGLIEPPPRNDAFPEWDP